MLVFHSSQRICHFGKTYFSQYTEIIFHPISARLSNREDVTKSKLTATFNRLNPPQNRFLRIPPPSSHVHLQKATRRTVRATAKKKVSALFDSRHVVAKQRSSLSRVVRQRFESARKIATASFFNPPHFSTSNNILSIASVSRFGAVFAVDRIIFSRRCRRMRACILT
jgi:hypothetical protein